MIISNNTSKPVPWYLNFSRNLLSFAKSSFKPIPVKFPFKYFIITVVATIILWTLIASAIIYRNAYKGTDHDLNINKLANHLNFLGRREKHRTEKAIKAFILAPFNWLGANIFPEQLPHIYIDLKYKHYLKILKTRENSIRSGHLIRTPDDYVPAFIKYKNKSHPVKLRLKGDLGSHWKGDKWSFRIKMKNKDSLFGMRRFSIQNPEERLYEGAIIFFEALRREGVLTPGYFFTDLTVNGKYIGIMAVEEHFSKELLESQGRKEGVILKYDESLWFKPRGRGGPFDSFRTNPIVPFRKNKISKSKNLSKDLKIAIGLLRGFANGTLDVAQVFDAELWGKYYAVASIWGGWHSIQWRNIRFYYNPITAKLEPIAFDEQLKYFKRNSFEPTSNKVPLAATIIGGDPQIKFFYEKTLAKLKKEAQDNITEEWVRPLQKRNLRILHKEYPLLGGINFFGLAKAASESLKRSKSHYQYSVILRAYSVEDESGSFLEISNPLPHSVIISSIYLVNKKNKNTIKFIPSSALALPFKILPTPKGTIPKTNKLYYTKREKHEDYQIFISAHIDGDLKNWKVKIEDYFPIAEKAPVPFSNINQLLKTHSFITYIDKTKTLKIKKGEWVVSNPLVIPQNVTLIIPEGTTLKFSSDSALIAKGAVMIQGTKDLPVVLTRLEKKGYWQGIVVLNSLKTSTWSHSKISYTSGINQNGWELTGGVTFYESDIEMNNIYFLENHTEDALNIVRSNFKLKNVTIKNTLSDAFDSDFSKGEVETSFFENIGSKGGGDGIDVSGSEVTVTNSYFKNISDKGISVGENSNLKATNIDIKNADIGIASKDGSLLFISDSKFSDIRKAGLMSYIKKPEYGSSEIMAKNITIESIGDNFISQNGSKITIDGVETSSVDLNVKNLYSSGVDQ
ncbi:MAG: hypothetical protein HOJ35_09690 [Bdellovibrionales bacterium]|nr:hypothetical protein [Bdellovibrionales bacterium]